MNRKRAKLIVTKNIRGEVLLLVGYGFSWNVNFSFTKIYSLVEAVLLGLVAEGGTSACTRRAISTRYLSHEFRLYTTTILTFG